MNSDYLRKIGAGYLNAVQGATNIALNDVAGDTNSKISLGFTSSGTNFIKLETFGYDAIDVKYYSPTGIISTNIPFTGNSGKYYSPEILKKNGMTISKYAFEKAMGYKYPSTEADFSGYNDNILTIISNATGETLDAQQAGVRLAVLSKSTSGTTNVVLF
jgi:hypothetical protein